MGNLNYGLSHLIYRHLICDFFLKNPHNYVNIYQHLGQYISLVNNSIDLIIPYRSNFINFSINI